MKVQSKYNNDHGLVIHEKPFKNPKGFALFTFDNFLVTGLFGKINSIGKDKFVEWLQSLHPIQKTK